ncbi:hypothetical protein CsSME_00032535 [Camellia sinensis var. sinensis]
MAFLLANGISSFSPHPHTETSKIPKLFLPKARIFEIFKP